ncbi:hypothetical protein [Paraburkholderia caribensis]|uniref:tetratricopeptide repeat protein n=1 Tax=Paraburkholderia caribensis TaxID=75105 RepID=UPI0031D181BD
MTSDFSSERANAQFSAGPRLDDGPVGDPRRQAVASLRGYAYQLYVSAVAWVELRAGERLYLEVAEDYAVAAEGALKGVQVKDTAQSGSVTINSADVLETIDAFVDLVERNPGLRVSVRFLSTSEIGQERSLKDRVEGESALRYWQKAAAGADVGPMRMALENASLSERARAFIAARDDDQLRREFLQRIHWDCGRPALEDIKSDLETALIEFGSERLRLTPRDCEVLPAVVLGKVLETTVGATPRRLMQADLLRVCEEHTRVSLPKSTLAVLLQSMEHGRTDGQLSMAPAEDLLEPATEFSFPQDLLPRSELVESIRAAVERHRVLFLTGGSGMGKTMLARFLARSASKPWHIVDLRDVTPEEAARRLQSALGQLSGVDTAGLILDDLNNGETHTVAQPLERLIRALRRRDVVCLITSYRAPTSVLLEKLSAEPEAAIAIPNLSEVEVGQLVRLFGGESDLWARYVYMEAGEGHPQLVRAMLTGLRMRGWPTAEVSDSASTLERSMDIEAARRAVRQRILDGLQNDARSLLYRTSLLLGRYERSLALDVATVVPQIDMAGEQLDTLVGPWIDMVGGSLLRNSPLIAQIGRDMLSTDEQTSVRVTAVKRLMAGNRLDVHQADAILTYALDGKSEEDLEHIAHTVIVLNEEGCRRLAAYLPTLKAMPLNSPAYPGNVVLSLKLRFAQMLVVAHSGEIDHIRATWQSLLRAMNESAELGLSHTFEYAVLTKILLSDTLAGLLPGWFEVLQRFDHLTLTTPEWRQLAQEAENEELKDSGTRHSIVGMLFVQQAVRLPTVREQLALFSRLDAVDVDVRGRFLGEARRLPSGYATLVNASWIQEVRRGTLDWESAASAFETMLGQALAWGDRELALRCVVAQAAMLDDYGSQEEAALEALKKGGAALGRDPVISRARAKIHFRHKRHALALELFREGAEQFALDDPVERAFLCREMGINTGETGKWEEASEWFRRAHQAAASAPGNLLNPMIIGLRADEALAAYKAGNTAHASELYGDVLQLLASLDGDDSLKAAYCQRVVRHGLLWMYDEATGSNVQVNDEPPVFKAGMCSNPEPLEIIRGQLVGSIDVSWYLLSAIKARHLSVSAAHRDLLARLQGRVIPGIELMIRNQLVAIAASQCDVDGLVEQMTPWLNVFGYASRHMAELTRHSNLENPVYAVVGEATDAELATPYVQEKIKDIVLSFGVSAAMDANRAAVIRLRSALDGHRVISQVRGLVESMLEGSSGEKTTIAFVCEAIHTVLSSNTLSPEQSYGVTVRFLEAVRRLNEPYFLTHRLVEWSQEVWERVVENRFNLRDPRVTVPMISEALALPSDGLSKVAKILLAAESAVSVFLHADLRAKLRLIAEKR